MADEVTTRRLNADVEEAMLAVADSFTNPKPAVGFISLFIIELIERGITFDYLPSRD